jgi:hypothetical protein
MLGLDLVAFGFLLSQVAVQPVAPVGRQAVLQQMLIDPLVQRAEKLPHVGLAAAVALPTRLAQ